MLVRESQCSDVVPVSDQAAEVLILHSPKTARQELPVSTSSVDHISKPAPAHLKLQISHLSGASPGFETN